MSIVLKYVHFFTKEGRLLKEIPRSEFPKELPLYISYQGNFFIRNSFSNDFTERDVYVYAEQPVTKPEKQQEGINSVGSVP